MRFIITGRKQNIQTSDQQIPEIPLSVTGSRSSGGIAYRLFFDLEPGAVYDYDESRSRSEAAVVCAGFG